MKLNVKNTIYVGLAFFTICMFWQVYDNVIAKMLINTFGLNQTGSGLIMALDNILALFLLPLFGSLSDKTKTKYGKRTPYIVIGTLSAAVLFAVVALIDGAQQLTSNIPLIEQQGNLYILNGISYETLEAASAARTALAWEFTTQHIYYLIAFVGVLLLVLIAMAVYRTPAVSLMPDVTPKPLRSKANAIINLMGTAGGVLALGYMGYLAKDYKPYTWAFIVTGIIMIISLIIFLLKVNEPKLVDEMKQISKDNDIVNEEDIIEKNDKKEKMPKPVLKSMIFILLSVFFWYMAYNAATTKFSVYAQNVLGMGFTLPLMIAQAAAAICFIPIGIISSKVGRKVTIIVGVILLFAAFLLGSFVEENTTILMYVTMAIAGIGWATINVNSYPMVVEMANDNNVGVYTGYYYTASMAAQIITPLLSGIFMDYIFKTMRCLFPYCCVFALLALITMLFVKHGDSKPIAKKSIEANND